MFSVSVGLMAIAGGIWAYYIGFVYPQFAVDPLITIAIVLMTFLGGRATLWGPVLGAAILMAAQQLLAYYIGGCRVYLVVYAAVFLVIMLLMPRGIVSTLGHRRRLGALAGRAAVAAGAGVPAAGEPLDLVTPGGGVSA